jgi:hypothetical protein
MGWTSILPSVPGSLVALGALGLTAWTSWRGDQSSYRALLGAARIGAEKETIHRSP